MRRIDIGSNGGRRPAPGFDMYTDKFRPEYPPTPFVCCPMEDMSYFQNKEFDYARCHHVIEHVDDPDRACAELQRIAKAGVISFPPPQAEMLFGRKDHNWYVFVDHGRLVFVEKFHPSLGVPRSQCGVELNVDFAWEDSFRWLTIRVPGSKR